MSNPSAAPRTVLELLRITTAYLQDRGIDTPRLDAEVLLADVLALDRVGLYVNYDRPLQHDEVDRYRQAVMRRAKREPVAYITEQKEFMGRAFKVSPAVLIPRSETELLVETVLQELATREQTAAPRLVDIGTGSGAIAISLALALPTAHITAVDISAEAIAVAQENARTHAVGERIDLVCGDLFANVPQGERYTCVVSNPPYIPAGELAGLAPEVRREPAAALVAGSDGLQVIRRLVADAPAWLEPDGLLALEIGAGQGAAVQALATAAGFAATKVISDYAGHDRVVIARLGV